MQRWIGPSTDNPLCRQSSRKKHLLPSIVCVSVIPIVWRMSRQGCRIAPVAGSYLDHNFVRNSWSAFSKRTQTLSLFPSSLTASKIEPPIPGMKSTGSNPSSLLIFSSFSPSSLFHGQGNGQGMFGNGKRNFLSSSMENVPVLNLQASLRAYGLTPYKFTARLQTVCDAKALGLPNLTLSGVKGATWVHISTSHKKKTYMKKKRCCHVFPVKTVHSQKT